MRTLPLLLAAGCRGTMLTQVETGYAVAPIRTPIEHSGVLQGHIGGSSEPGFGIGVSARARAFSGGWAFPEVGPHGFVMFDDDEHFGAYLRAGTLVGLGGHDGELGPMFTAQVSPGILIYPSPDDPLAITVSFTAELSGSPVIGYGRFWAGVQIGFALGGVEED
jgi:hypothetical protein